MGPEADPSLPQTWGQGRPLPGGWFPGVRWGSARGTATPGAKHPRSIQTWSPCRESSPRVGAGVGPGSGLPHAIRTQATPFPHRSKGPRGRAASMQDTWAWRLNGDSGGGGAAGA